MLALSWLIAGASLEAWIGPSWSGANSPAATSNREMYSAAATHGLSLGVLGGFRALAADIIWLRAYIAWENKEAVRTESLVNFAATLDERPLTFWLNGARMIAYDIPAWQLNGNDLNASAVEQKRFSDQQARRALAFLNRAITCHPENADIWIECGNIELYRLHDVPAAAESYRRAALQPGAPYHAGRVYAELLRRLGRRAEALDWLKAWHPHLPRNLEAAAAEVVLARIRLLESELCIDAADRYEPND